MKTIRWGILAPGRIATKFAMGLQTLPGAKLQAVASRTPEKAAAFAAEFDIPEVYPDYQALAESDTVDIIYVAPPHTFHHQNVLRCLEAGKPVLCEKPIGVNYRETKEMFALAEAKGLFLMEAMWTRFLPAWYTLRSWIAEGRIGKIKQVYADFGFQGADDPQNRVLNPDLAGGALLDVGIYPVALAYMLFGEDPIHISSFADLGRTGVDEQSAYLFGYTGGRFALLSSAVQTNSPREAKIIGTNGIITVPMFWRATEATIQLTDQEPETHSLPFESSGLQYQAIAVMEALRQGKLETELMPWSESLRIMKTMDTLRAQWGLSYPFE